MIYTVKEYSETMLFRGRKVSEKTIIRRIQQNKLPTNHISRKVGRNYIIEVKNDFKELQPC